MNNVKLIKQVVLMFLVLLNLSLVGCPAGDKIVSPKMVKGTFDTFTVYPLCKNDKVKSVVLSRQSYEDVAWKIVATDSVLVDGFSVRIGVVPDGFKQLVPVGQECFIPKAGKEYSIVIVTDNINERFSYADTMWTGK